MLWGPDSRRFVYSAGDDQEWLNRNSKLWLMEAELGEHRLLTADFAGNVSCATWSTDGSHLFFNGTQGPNSNVFRVVAETGVVDQVTDLDG